MWLNSSYDKSRWKILPKINTASHFVMLEPHIYLQSPTFGVHLSSLGWFVQLCPLNTLWSKPFYASLTVCEEEFTCWKENLLDHRSSGVFLLLFSPMLSTFSYIYWLTSSMPWYCHHKRDVISINVWYIVKMFSLSFPHLVASTLLTDICPKR